MHRKGKYLKNNISLSEVKVEEENDYARKIFLGEKCIGMENHPINKMSLKVFLFKNFVTYRTPYTCPAVLSSAGEETSACP
jgi:hypothetical protein